MSDTKSQRLISIEERYLDRPMTPQMLAMANGEIQSIIDNCSNYREVSSSDAECLSFLLQVRVAIDQEIERRNPTPKPQMYWNGKLT